MYSLEEVMKKGIQLLVYKESSGGRNSETSLLQTGAVTGPLGKANTVCLVTGYDTGHTKPPIRYSCQSS